MRADRLRRAARPLVFPGLAGVGLIACLSANTGVAQASDATSPPPGSRSDMFIVVTARKTEEQSQRVPISIATLDAATLGRTGAVTLADIARTVPNLSIARASVLGAEQPTIRGIFSPVGASTIGLYVDDVPVETRSLEVASNLDLRTFDLSRVEILRGPQGTLFGASSLGGTIRYLTNQPDLTSSSGYLSGRLSQVTGGGVNRELQGAIGVPVVPGLLGARVSGYVRHDAGYIDRIDRASGRVVDSDIGHVSAFALRAGLKAALGERVEVTPVLFYQESRRDDLPFQDSDLPPYRQGGIVSQPGRDASTLASLSARVELGAATLTSVSAYLDRANHQITDYSTLFGELVLGGSVAGLTTPGGSPSATYVRQRSISQEIRLASSDAAALRWVVGGFWRREHFVLEQTLREPGIAQLAQDYLGQSVAALFGVPLLPGGVSYYSLQNIDETEVAGFGQASWRFARGWEATAGLRLTHARLGLSSTSAGPYANPVPGDGTTRHDSDIPATPSVGLSYQPGETSFFYLSASKGFRAGGSNAAVPVDACAADLNAVGRTAAPASYGADSLWNYEAGAKASLFGQRVRIAIAAFQIDWQNVQQSVALPDCGFSYIDNLGAARNRGFELELEGRPWRSLLINGALGFVDARFRRDVVASGASGPAAPATYIVSAGDHVPFVPRWSARVSAEYAVPLSATLQAYMASAYQYAGAYRRAPSPQSVTYDPRTYRGDAYGALSARVGLRNARWQLALAVTNLLNDRAIMFDNIDLVPASGSPHRQLTQRPRSFMMSGTVDF